MTFSELIAAMIIFSLFMAGFSQAATPAFEAWSHAAYEYQNAKSIEFVAKSFQSECAKPNRDIENWKKAVSVVPQLASYEIEEITQAGIIRALRLTCVVGSEHIEVIGLCGL